MNQSATTDQPGSPGRKVFYRAETDIKKGDIIAVSDGKAWPVGSMAEAPEKNDDHFGWPWAAMLAAFFVAVAYIVEVMYIVTHIQ